MYTRENKSKLMNEPIRDGMDIDQPIQCNSLTSPDTSSNELKPYVSNADLDWAEVSKRVVELYRDTLKLLSE